MEKGEKQKDIFGDTTNNCHYKYDFSDNYSEMCKYTWEYLSSLYEGLNKENLVYHKYNY